MGLKAVKSEKNHRTSIRRRNSAWKSCPALCVCVCVCVCVCGCVLQERQKGLITAFKGRERECVWNASHRERERPSVN